MPFANSIFDIKVNDPSQIKDAIAHTSMVQSATQTSEMVGNVTFNVTNQKSFANISATMNPAKHYLSREEVAARHVVKELSKFDGNPRAWPRFITSFNRSTEVCGFNNLENLERLTNSLSGRALTAVESSLTMEENLPRILATLEMIFGKPEFIITSLIDEMRKSSPPSADNIDSIIRYALEVENISVTMKIAKLSEHLWNPILLSEMVERLPCQLKLEWATHKFNNPESNIEVFGLWLKQKAMTYATILVKPPNILSSSEKHKSRHSFNIHQESEPRKCIVCAEKCDNLESCEKFKEMSLNDKWNVVKNNHLCRICLIQHKSKMCSRQDLCGIDDCQYRHHALLHKSRRRNNEDVHDVNLHVNESQTYFKILPVCLRNGSKSITVFAMLDDGSSITLIDDKVAKYLELYGENQPLCLRWTNDVERRDNNSEIVKLNISQSSNSKKQFLLGDVRTVQNLSLPIQTVIIEELRKSYKHLKGVPVESYENAQPLLLIGLNHTKLMAMKKYRFGKDGEPSAAKTALVWCIFGSKVGNSSDIFHINHCDCEKELDSRLEEIVRKNYSLEAIGVSKAIHRPHHDPMMI